MQYVEKPPHIDPVRMRHITDEDLLAATGTATVEELRRHLSTRTGPRPVFDVARWAAGMSGTETAAQAVAAADELLGTEVDFLDKGRGRSRLYGFHYLRWMSPLVSAYALTGDPAYAKEWDRLFGQWYDSRDQVAGDWPGLDVVWYSLGVWSRSSLITQALAVFGEEPALSREGWLRMVKTVLGGARWAAEEHDEFRQGNWQFACASELLHVAAVFPEFDEASGWAEVAKARILDHLELDVRADGGHHERSPGYHSMCVEAVQRAAVIGEQYLGWDLAAHPRVRAMHDWYVALVTPAGWIPHLQDSGLYWPAAHLLRGHYLLGDPGYEALARRWLTPEQLRGELAWLPPRPDGAPAPVPAVEPDSSSRTLDTSRYAVFRTGWEPDSLHTVVNYGPFVGHELEPHSHHAALDFVLSGWGVPLAWEAGGPPSYDDPGYYDWFQATRGHNTVLLPGEEFAADRDATCDTFAALPHVDVFAGHHHGYPKRHDRRIVFVRESPSYWLVTDEIEDGPEAVWQVHGRSPWSERAGGHANVRGPGLYVLPAEPEAVTGVLHGSGPSRIPDPSTRTAEYGEIHTLGLRQRAGTFTVGLFPYAEDPPAVRLRGGEVSLDGVVDAFSGHQWTRCDTGGVLLAAACWGPSLVHDGIALVEARGLVAADVTYEGGFAAVVDTDRCTELRVHAPGVSRLALNGVRLRPGLTVTLPSSGRWRLEAAADE
ncbi:heparinase II/III family protein [Streptosporangium canum]|uniref:heparinase II/III family protein n=1 Tax=Streptosporangium canum TaxID=324952 RepID=UPI003688274A